MRLHQFGFSSLLCVALMGCARVPESASEQPISVAPSSALEEAAKTQPTPETLVTLSLEYYGRGEFQRSLDSATAALKLRPDYAAAQNNVAVSLIKLGRYDEAIKAAEATLRLAPGAELYVNNLKWAIREKVAHAAKK